MPSGHTVLTFAPRFHVTILIYVEFPEIYQDFALKKGDTDIAQLSYLHKKQEQKKTLQDHSNRQQ